MDELEAYKAMQIFLEKIYNQTSSDDIGSLLGDMILLEDNSTMDAAIWNDWIEAVKKVMK